MPSGRIIRTRLAEEHRRDWLIASRSHSRRCWSRWSLVRRPRMPSPVSRLAKRISPSGLILSYSVFNLPFAIWMLKGFIEDLPREIEEAAKVDGASRFQIFRNIVLPLVAPGLVVVALFTFIFAWNDFAYAVIFSGSNVTP